MICQCASIGLRCYSPKACSDFGYCRERNFIKGGMKNVTPEMQREWRAIDNVETDK